MSKIDTHREGQRICEKVTKVFGANVTYWTNCPYTIYEISAKDLFGGHDRSGYAVVNTDETAPFDYSSEYAEYKPELARFTQLNEAINFSGNLNKLREEKYKTGTFHLLPISEEWFYMNLDLYYKAGIPCWQEITEENYYGMLECLPPIYVSGVSGFMMSEAQNGDLRAGFVEKLGRFFACYSTMKNFGEAQRQLDKILLQ